MNSGMTLSQYTAWIGEALRRVPELWNAWVMAELSDVRVSGGHCYMELIEKNAAGQTVAKMRATIWASTFYSIRRKFFEATGREIAAGMKVLLRGAVSHHSLYGMAFNVADIDPSYTLGDLERLRQEILDRLAKEGILNRNKAEHLPIAPQRIAVVSAEGAAGYGDFMNQLLGNTDGFEFYPFLFPAVMQGERTSSSVRTSLEKIEQTIDLWDCVVIIRGGGATTDLNGFDDYDLAKAVATFPLPVIVGIGHERDRTVLDEIAHTRVKTPTAVAGFLIDRLREAEGRASGLADWIARYSTERVKGESRRLAAIEGMLPALANSAVATASSILQREMTRIPVLVTARLEKSALLIDRYAEQLSVITSMRTSRASDKLSEIERNINVVVERAIEKKKVALANLESLVNVLSPVNTLSRGYSITRVKGKAVTDVGNLPVGTRFTTTLLNGEVEGEVIPQSPNDSISPMTPSPNP